MTKKTMDQVVLVTGCSSGFGLLTAARLASKGYRVAATMRDLNKAPALLDEVKRRGGEVALVQLDVTDKESIERALVEVGDRFGKVDVLINNAGFALGGFFEDMQDDEIRAQFETNFFGVQNVTRAVIPLMRPLGRGRIINISSASGFYASPGLGAYSASKWALEAFSESLRYELQPFGIKVLLVEPGTYKTRIFYENARYARHFNSESSPYFTFSHRMANMVRAHVDDCFKDPEDVAALIERLITARHPAFRNIPDIETQVHHLVRKCLPFTCYSFIVRQVLARTIFAKAR